MDQLQALDAYLKRVANRPVNDDALISGEVDPIVRTKNGVR
jgi:hypothetical protein